MYPESQYGSLFTRPSQDGPQPRGEGGIEPSAFPAVGSVGRQGPTVDDINPAFTLRALNYGNYGRFLIMGTTQDLYRQP